MDSCYRLVRCFGEDMSPTDKKVSGQVEECCVGRVKLGALEGDGDQQKGR